MLMQRYPQYLLHPTLLVCDNTKISPISLPSTLLLCAYAKISSISPPVHTPCVCLYKDVLNLSTPYTLLLSV